MRYLVLLLLFLAGCSGEVSNLQKECGEDVRFSQSTKSFVIGSGYCVDTGPRTECTNGDKAQLLIAEYYLVHTKDTECVQNKAFEQFVEQYVPCGDIVNRLAAFREKSQACASNKYNPDCYGRLHSLVWYSDFETMIPYLEAMSTMKCKAE